MSRPVVWKMITEAIENLNQRATYSQIKKYIKEKWNYDKPGTINDQIAVMTVNHNSRIHYEENNKPRLTNTNSHFDLLFSTGRGQVVKYNPIEHGIWEIYQEGNGKLAVRPFSNASRIKIYTPTDILWFKNVTNAENGEAYLDVTENSFILHFPTIHRTNVLSPSIGDIILIRQKLNDIPAFTHLVTPIDNELIDENIRPDFRYGRRVKIIAKTNRDNFIPVTSTLWVRLNFAGITQGNACRLENISNIGNIDELQFDIWQKFNDHFVPSEQQSTTTTSAIIIELETTNPDLTVTEGELRLVAHLVKERNPKIVREKKQQAINNNALRCEVCAFSFPETFHYNFIECHHLSPIGQTGVRETRLEDLALVCANCHRMLHTKFDGQYLSIQQLQTRIKALLKG